MKEYGKYEILKTEGDAYFERNKVAFENGGESVGFRFIADFLKNLNFNGEGKKLVEIGCCSGYNLAFISQEFPGLSCMGVEPSEKAVKEGNEKYSSETIEIIRGTSDELEVETNTVDIVVCGFCLYTVERSLMLRTISEIDRVLKEGGILITYDFDVPIPRIRDNVHNSLVPVFKVDLASMICSNPQYTLIEKKSFSHMGNSFVTDIQERCAINYIYKEKLEDVYIRG